MKISKLELQRFINVYTEYREDQSNESLSEVWLENHKYLENNDLYDICNIVEELVSQISIKPTFEQIVEVLQVLDVEVVWNERNKV